MSAIFISEFSSLNFRKDWKLSFQQNVDYIPKFLPTDNIQVQYVVKDFTLTPYLKNICTGEVQQLSPVLLLETESEKCYQLTINNSSISSDTEFNLYFASDQDGEKIKDANFCVCTELPDTILLEYTNRKNVYETIFDGIDRFLFRVEGAFLPQEISFENNTEEFRDQRYVSKILSSTAFEKKTLTLGGGMGVPNWVARKINLIFSLSSVHVEGNPMVRSDGGAVELTEIGKYYPLYIYKIVLEDGEDNEDTGDGIIEYLRAVDEKKKIIRKSSENDLRVYLEGTGIDTAKMIRELELIGELSMNYTIEIDDNISGSTNKTTLQSLIQFISKDFVTNNKFKEYIDQPVRTTDDVKFNSVVAKESIKTGKVTTEEVVSKNFTSGLLGVGHRLWNGVLEVSELIVRKTMHVFKIIVQEVYSVNGSMLTTPGGGVRISEVEELEDGYKCLFNNDDGTIPNPFIVGDQALHQVFTGKNIGRYWRLVTEVGDNYFVLSKTDCEPGSGIPQVEDEIIQFGNRTDKNRQNAVLTTSYGSDAPYTAYYSNVNSYSLEGKEDVREGNLRGINDPDFGQLQGSGFYGKNVYLKGIFRLLSGKTVEESIGDVQSNLDNLQVGETNLLDNSNKGWKNTGYPIATIYLGDYKPKQGEECTIVIKGKLGANKTSWGVYNSGGNVVLASFYPGGPDTDYIALKTFKWTLGTPAVDNTFIRIYPMPNSVSVESEIEWVKLVLGNKTSLLWTPSINDQRQIAIDEAGKAVDGIQVGGVNILIGSTTGTGWTGYTEHKDTEFSIKDASTIESYIRSAMITIPGNKEIVVSFYAKHTGHQNYFDFYILPASYPEIDALLTSSYQSGTDWTYNEFKFTTPSDWGEGTLVYLRIDHNGMSDGSEFIISVKDVQIEYGNKATTYSVPESDRKEIAKQQGLEGGQEAVNGLQIGSQNLISKKMMLKWNEKNKDIAVWGQDEDGIYLDVTPKLLFNNITTISVLHPVFDITFKPKSQYVFSIEWKHKSPNPDNTGLAFYIGYDDGTRSNVFLTKDIKTKTITNVISSAGKTISKIYSGYGNGDINALIYNISLIEGNKPLQGFPVAEEDQTGANNVNLADGTKEFTLGVGSTNYTYKELYVSKIKPNTVYYVNAGNIQNLVGNPDRYSFVLYNKDVSTVLCPTLNADKNGGFLITYNNFTEQEGRLLCYAGIVGSTLGNSVKFTEVMLVEGFLPAPVWTPSFAEQQTSIDAANSAAKLAQQTAENAQITATEATTKLNNWASDSLISPPEKPAMRQQQADIQAEYKEIKANVEKYSLTDNAAWINYNNAYSLANTALTKYTASSPENITISSDYSNIAAYYPKRQEILNAISSAAIDEAKEYTTIQTYRETDIDLRAEKWDQDTYYPVTIKLSNPETRIEVVSPLDNYFGIPKWSAHELGFSMHCVWRSNGSNWNSNIVKRTIEVFEYKYTEQNIPPAGSIGQLTSSSEELIYLRGGGRYLFKIGTNCVAVVHDSRYTAPDGSSVAPSASVIRPVPDLEALDYLKIALKEETTIEGGLISTSLIKVGAKQNGVNWNERAGICGIGDTDNSIRFYAGGDLDSAIRRVSGGDGTKANFVVTQAGRLFASDAIIEGNITVKNLTTASGKVVITESGQLVVSDAEIQGRIIATSGEFTGKITVTSGIIGGFEIGSTYIQNGGLKLSSGSIEYKKDKLQSSFGALYTGITGIATGLYIKNTAISTMNRHELCAYFQGSIGDLQINSSKAMIETYNVSSMHYALYIPSGQVYMNANSGGIFFKNVQNVNGKSNYYLCIDRSTGQLYYR